MYRFGYKNRVLFLSLVFLLAAISGCSISPANSTEASRIHPVYSIGVETLPTIGDYLTDQSGMTLYYTINDTARRSGISGSILLDWPVFYVATISVQPPLRKTDFSTILRPDGKYQTTYKGWPLYFYSMDMEPSDTLGQGVAGVWFIAAVNVPDPKSLTPSN